MEIPEEIIDFLKRQKVVMVITLDEEGRIHCAAKGIISIEPRGKIFVIDLFSGRTLRNLEKRPDVSITAIDEENFVGYNLQGRAKIISQNGIHKDVIDKWQEKISKRISDRIIDSVRTGKKSKEIYEAKLFFHPKHLIEIDVENIINLSL